MGSKEYMQDQPSTIIVKAWFKDHTTSSFQSSKVKGGEASHIYMSKTSISSRIQNFWKGPIRIFPLDGQIKGEIVLGIIDGNKLGGSGYLCVFKLIGLMYTWFIRYIFKNWECISICTWVPLYIMFSLKDMPTIYKYHRSWMGLPYRSMCGGSFRKLTI